MQVEEAAHLVAHPPIRRVVERVLAFRVKRRMRLLGISWIAIAVARTCCAVTPPVFTADYYLMDPQRYLNKKTTLAVAFLTPRSEQRPDHLRLLDAYTYNLGQSGGHISVVTPRSNVQRLITLCGTRLRFSGRRVKITMLKGTFLQERHGNREYYFFVP
jgi:hypothetical protein